MPEHTTPPQLEQQRPSSRNRPALARLEARMMAGPGYDIPGSLANLMIARWRGERGEYASALAATRRRIRGWTNRLNTVLDPIHLREEGRFAEQTGDTVGALRALQHFIVLRDSPDTPELAQDVEQVRLRLSRLRAGNR